MYLPPNTDIFAIQYGGIIENISIELDMASRTKIMNLIDDARKAGKLMRDRRYNRNSIFKLDINTFKIVTDDNKQDVLVRMPIHQVACFSYVYEDDQHIIAIKYGEVDMKRSHNNEVDEELICRLIICFCDSKQSAERLCSFTERCFSEVFNRETTAMMTSHHTRSTSLTNNNHNNNNNNNNNNNKSNNNIYDDGLRISSMSSADSLNGPLNKAKYSFLSNSCLDVRDLPDANGGLQLSSIFNSSSGSGNNYSNSNTIVNNNNSSNNSNINNSNRSDVTNDVINQGYVSESDSSQLSMKEQELIRDYMRKLYNVLTNAELENFAQLVKFWQRDIPFHDFMNQLLQLYGEKRKYLLKEMRPFIPSKDVPYYESFLAQHQLTNDKK